jgi:hypothetical protein
MKKVLIFLLLILGAVAHAQEVQSADDANAQTAARTVLQLFSDGKFNTVWSSMTSEWMKTLWTKDLFLSNYSIWRPKLGKLLSTVRVSQNHFSNDPTTNFHGDGYTITFKSRYEAGEFYEVVGVVKDPDGRYRFSGIDGGPVPKDQQ